MVSEENAVLNEQETETESAANDTVHVDSDGNRVVPASALRKPPVPNPTIRMADGSTVKGTAAVGTASNELWVWIDKDSGETMQTMFPVFSNPEKTRHIETTYLDTDTPTVYEGYTVLNVIKQNHAGEISIRLAHE